MELYNSSKYVRYLIHLFHDGPLKAPQHSKAHVQKFDIQAFPDGCLGPRLYRCDNRFFFHNDDNLIPSKRSVRLWANLDAWQAMSHVMFLFYLAKLNGQHLRSSLISANSFACGRAVPATGAEGS
jgi:hypothetical protein